MPTASLLEALTAYISFLFAIVLAFRRRGNRVANLTLSALLFSLAMESAHVALWQTGFYRREPQFLFILNLFGPLIAPLLLFYTRGLCERGFAYRRRDLLHALPFVALAVYCVATFHVLPLDEKLEILAGDRLMTTANLVVIPFLGQIQMLAYLAASWIVSKRQSRTHREVFSDPSQMSLTWLRFVLAGLALFWTIGLGRLLLYLAGVEISIVVGVEYLQSVVTFAFVNLAITRGLRQGDLFHREVEILSSPTASTRDTERSRGDFERLEAFMKLDRPYLDPQLTLGRLADGLDLPPRQLSRSINENGTSFFDYVNRYRVEGAKSRLLEDRDRKILDILYEVGFNSKSAFHTAFKKHAGQTPSSFRRSQN